MSRLRTAEWARRFRKRRKQRMPRPTSEENVVLSLEYGVFVISYNVHVRKRWIIGLGHEGGIVLLARHHWNLWEEWQLLLEKLEMQPAIRKMQWSYEEAMKLWQEKEDELRRENFWYIAKRLR